LQANGELPAYLSTNPGLKIVDNLKANDGEARENRRHHACSFFEQPESLYGSLHSRVGIHPF
ncbi:hypothetical protein, partial [Klebsiella pneumoniae]|uniref:hypothetical protein n=1 Tax=Klebsiella pneumoniae TaxID=573 RepID=UPI001CA36617